MCNFPIGYKTLIAISILLFVTSNCLAVSYLDRQLIILSKNLINDCNSKLERNGLPVTIAILPFSSPSKDLKARKIDIGISELLISYLTKYGVNTFKIIERNQLENVLSENALKISGIIDQTNSTKIGQTLGAKLLLIGSVTSSQENYIVQARAVKSETGEIISSYSLPLPSEQFEKEAKKYVIPKKESIGVYLAYRQFKVKKINTEGVVFTSNNGGNFQTVTDIKTSIPDYISAGVVGNKFYLMDRIMVDVSLTLAPTKSANNEKYTYIFTERDALNNIINTENISTYLTSPDNFQIVIHYVQPITPKLDLFLGPSINFFTELDSGYTSPVMVGIRTGFEYRPFQKFGISFFGNYFFETDRVFSRIGGLNEKPKVYLYKWDNNSVEINLTYYF